MSCRFSRTETRTNPQKKLPASRGCKALPPWNGPPRAVGARPTSHQQNSRREFNPPPPLTTHHEEDAHEINDERLQPHGDDDDGHEGGALQQPGEEVVLVGDAAGADLIEDLAEKEVRGEI